MYLGQDGDGLDSNVKFDEDEQTELLIYRGEES